LELTTTTSEPTTTTTTETGCQKPGDLDLNDRVTIAEEVSVSRMFLGLDPVNPLADSDNDGVVQIWDVLKVINCYLENEYCSCLDQPVAP
jgi:hypothetical protein